MAGRPGFEPELLGPEPRVLPLNYLPMLDLYQAYHAIYFILSRFFPFASNFIQKKFFSSPGSLNKTINKKMNEHFINILHFINSNQLT